MAFRATRKAAYSEATSRASQLKKLCEDSKAAMLAGPVSANVVKQLLLTAIEVKALNQATAAVPGIADYAMAQEGDEAYDPAAEWTAMNAAIDALGAQILADVPTGTGGFRLVETWTGAGVSTRTFTTAQTATLRARLDDVIATID